MYRVTRSSTRISEKAKENIAVDFNVLKKNVKKRKSPTSSEASEESSPAKSTRSRSGSFTNSSSSSSCSSSPKSTPSEKSESSRSRSKSTPGLRAQFENKLKLTSPEAIKPRSVRRALVDNSELRLPGRENEFEFLTSYLRNIAEAEGSGSLYISGAPGTGKTATLMKIINSKEFKKTFRIAFINCTGISSIGAIYNRICHKLNLNITGTEKDYLAAIEKHLVKRHKMTLLILDEIDQLSSYGKQLEVLYHIFEWPSIANSKMILVGIANSLDLTDRLLVRLQTKCELKPKALHFSAYTKSQIVEIFKSRLEESGVSDMFPPVAIQLLAAKVSAVSGDIRRALNIGKRVVELAEVERKKNSKKIDMRKIESLITQEETLACEPEKEQPIQLREVVSVLNEVYGNTQKLGEDDNNDFPIQQKILICSILLIMKHETKKPITAGRLNEVFKKACKGRNISTIDFSEFLSLCGLAENQGIIRIVKKKEQRFCQIEMQWNEDEVFAALKDKQMVSNIIHEKNLLRR